MKKKFILLIALLMIFTSCTEKTETKVDNSIESAGEDGGIVARAIDETVDIIVKKSDESEEEGYNNWEVFDCARSNRSVPKDFYERYYSGLEERLRENDGVLSERKYTEYSKNVLALTAMGKDPEDVAGYNLLLPLGDFEKTSFQGVNGSIFALIAFDSGNYDVPVNEEAETQATRDLYIEDILSYEVEGGGFGFDGSDKESPPDSDITGMALQALSKYQDNENVKGATERALVALSKIQGESGAFSSGGTENSESTVQVLVALTELGIGPEDERFVKNGNSIMDALQSFYCEGGGFKHVQSDGFDSMATEQGLYGLIAYERFSKGDSSLYRIK